jgi:hypothetical protein
MEYLSGFTEYRKENQGKSIFNTAMDSGTDWCLHLHGVPSMIGRVVEVDTYYIVVQPSEAGRTELKKLSVKYLYPVTEQEKIQPLIKKLDKKVKKMNLSPLISTKGRTFVKNKTLYPLMKEREVMFFTLLEGDIIRGMILNFSMFDITMGLKGGVPLTFLRHSIYDVRNKAGHCFLKSVQDKVQDWKKSSLYVQDESI